MKSTEPITILPYVLQSSQRKLKRLDDAIRYINKMNKTRSSKLTRKTQHPMRVLFKLRQNHKGVMRTVEDKSQESDSLNLTNAINMDDSRSTFLDKRYESKNRMKTEYSDRFGSFGVGNRSFIAAKNTRETHGIVNESDQIAVQGKKDTARFNNHSPDNGSIQPKQRQQATSELNPQAATFQAIEEKIESLMNKRLEECMQFKKNSDWVIDNELSKLVDTYKEIKASNSAQNQEDIQLMQRKINLLEKLIAENMVQSDIAKKYYLSKVANSHWKHYKTESFSAIEPVKELKNRQIRHQSLISTSNNQQSYHKPQRSAYNIQKPGYYNYNPDRHKQPLPRSSYNRDFLIYGAIRNPSSCKPIENQSIKPASSAKLMNSSYKLSFGPKKAEKINTKQLDACRDKIKNLPVIFGKREKEAIAYNLATYFKQKKKEGTSHSMDRIEPKPITNHFITQSRKEFIQATQISPSQIKHQNLHRLKYSYKKELHM